MCTYNASFCNVILYSVLEVDLYIRGGTAFIFKVSQIAIKTWVS